MQRTLAETAFTIDGSLKSAEGSTDEAAIASTRLLLTLLVEHEASGVADTIGLAAIGHATRATTLSVEAREAHIRAHRALNFDLKKLGMSEMFSKPDDPPSNNKIGFSRVLTGELVSPNRG